MAALDMPINSMTKAQVMQQYNEAAFTNWNENVLDACPNCNRTFLPKALAIHLKSCKTGKPLKPPIKRVAAGNAGEFLFKQDTEEEKV